MTLLLAIGTASCTTLLFFDPKARVDGGDRGGGSATDGSGGGSANGGSGGGQETGGSGGGAATGGGSGGGVATGGSGGGAATGGGSGGGVATGGSGNGGGTAGGPGGGSTGGGSGGGGASGCTGGGTNCPIATNITRTSVTLTWGANGESDLAGYKIHRGTTSMMYTPIAVVQKIPTTYTVTGLMPGTTYYFVVTAFDSAGNESGYSEEVSVTTPL